MFKIELFPWKISLNKIFEMGEFNISAQNDVDFPPISLKLDKYLLIVH
jgi:hypothetical protein